MQIFPFGEIPPELQAQLQEQAKMQSAMRDDFGHGVARLMTECDQDTLEVIRDMMHYIVAASASPLAAYWEGIAAASLQHRYQICSTHEVNHDHEMAQEMQPPYASYLGPESVDKEAVAPTPADSISRGRAGCLDSSDHEKMKTYHIDDAYDEDTHSFLGFICTGIVGGPSGGCKTIYVSIEDRMLREPESCSGCFQKAAHG